MRVLLIIFCLALTLTAAASEPGASKPYERWKKADRDGDGYLTRAESAAIRSLAQHFDAIDGDGDGRISLQEVRLWRSAAVRPRAPAKSGSSPLFARVDANEDGVISRSEAAGLARLAMRFDQIDADRNGSLSREEVERWLAARRTLRSGAK